MELNSIILAAFVAMVATSFGSLVVILLKSRCVLNYAPLLAFSAGVMAFSAMEMLHESYNSSGEIASIIGVVVGVVTILIAEKSIPHIHRWLKKKEINESKKKAALIAGSIGIHNVPEGFAIASAFAGSGQLGWLVATSISLQDIPEGFMVTAPLSCYGVKSNKALFYGILSGVIEFISAIIGYVFLSMVSWITPFALAFSAGAMGYVVLVELLPDALSEGKEHITALAFLIGILTISGIGMILGL